MKKMIFISASLVILASFLSGFYMIAEDQVAIFTKVYNDVQVKPEKGSWYAAKRAGALQNGDNIKTGDQSNAVVKFMDGSILRIRPKSELTVFSERNGSKVDKSISVDVGTIGFDVRKRKDEAFRFTSPTSVASIRGTDGGYSTDDAADVLTILTGLAELENKVTGKKVEVKSGETGELNKKTGEISFRKSTESDLNNANSANSESSGKSHTIKIEFKMEDQSTKNLEIQYEE